ncbi:hypothetical protein SO802_026363 [Lithocarpus litseifolius]|uniref:Myb/SANT-like domain-containing protein n=1 Tax=Lithocarpus litseifolius TaxID=425828 RepID=A0AAW2C0Z1_9ROSI
MAVVEQENKDNWIWFLEQFVDEIGRLGELNLVFISGRQKGLLLAIETLFPTVEHKYCVKHIYNNFKVNHKSIELKSVLWRCAGTTSAREFERGMDHLKSLDEEAWKYLADIELAQWTKSHFSTRALTDCMVNNLSESFNSMIVKARDKPILSMLESIRVRLITKLYTKKIGIEKYRGKLCPSIQDKLEKLKLESKGFCAMPSERFVYEVDNERERHVVDLVGKTCSCRGLSIPHFSRPPQNSHLISLPLPSSLSRIVSSLCSALLCSLQGATSFSMGKKATSNSEAKKARALWDNPIWTTTFCDLCVELIDAGHRTSGACFSRKGWVILVTKFCEQTGLDYDKDQLKSRWDVLKGDWKVWHQLKNLDIGLGWDAVKGTIDATNDWWDRKLKELPKATKFRQQGLQNIEQLDRMFRDVAATGEAAWTPSSNTLPPTMPQEGVGDSDGQKRTSESIPSQKKKKKIGGAAMLDDRISELINVCKNKSEGTSRELPSSIDNVMKIVRALPGVDNSFMVQAFYVLLKKSRREMFLTFNEPESQLEWLHGMIWSQKK